MPTKHSHLNRLRTHRAIGKQCVISPKGVCVTWDWEVQLVNDHKLCPLFCINEIKFE